MSLVGGCCSISGIHVPTTVPMMSDSLFTLYFLGSFLCIYLSVTLFLVRLSSVFEQLLHLKWTFHQKIQFRVQTIHDYSNCTVCCFMDSFRSLFERDKMCLFVSSRSLFFIAIKLSAESLNNYSSQKSQQNWVQPLKWYFIYYQTVTQLPGTRTQSHTCIHDESHTSLLPTLSILTKRSRRCRLSGFKNF